MPIGQGKIGLILALALALFPLANASPIGLHTRAGFGCPSWAAGLQVRQDPYRVTAAFGPCHGESYLSLGLGYDTPWRPFTLQIELASMAGNPTTSLAIGAYWSYRSILGSVRLEALVGGGAAWTLLGALPLYQAGVAVTFYPPFELTPLVGALTGTAGPSCANPRDPPSGSIEPSLERLKQRTLAAFLSANGDIYALRSIEIDIHEIARQKTRPRSREDILLCFSISEAAAPKPTLAPDGVALQILCKPT